MKFLQKDHYDQCNNSHKAQSFEIGDKAWLYAQAINNKEIKKLRLRWVGVYIIHSRVSENFMLQLEGKILKSPIHQKRLRRFLEGADRPSEEITVEDFSNVPTDLVPQNEYNILYL